MQVSFAERPAGQTADPKRMVSARSRSILKSGKAGGGGGGGPGLSPEELLQSVQTAVVKPLSEWASSLFGRHSDGLEGQDEKEEELGGEGEEVQESAPRSRDVLTMTCTDEASTVRDIKICPNDSYEDFIDFIKNEFGETLWPVYQDPNTGKRLLVINDDKFDRLCAETVAEQGRVKVLLYKKIEAQEYEL